MYSSFTINGICNAAHAVQIYSETKHSPDIAEENVLGVKGEGAGQLRRCSRGA